MRNMQEDHFDFFVPGPTGPERVIAFRGEPDILTSCLKFIVKGAHAWISGRPIDADSIVNAFPIDPVHFVQAHVSLADAIEAIPIHMSTEDASVQAFYWHLDAGRPGESSLWFFVFLRGTIFYADVISPRLFGVDRQRFGQWVAEQVF